MMSDDFLSVENELVRDRDCLQVPSSGLRPLLPESGETHPFQ